MVPVEPGLDARDLANVRVGVPGEGVGAAEVTDFGRAEPERGHPAGEARQASAVMSRHGGCKHPPYARPSFVLLIELSVMYLFHSFPQREAWSKN
jgi:hypothetical protein